MEIMNINLQLFAENTQTLSTLSVENKTFYDKVLIREASANLVHDQFAQKRPIPRNGGRTIEFRKFAALGKALTPLTEGVTPTGQNINISADTATVSQYGGYVVLSDVLELSAIDNVVVETVELIGKQAGLTLDTITRNELNGGTNVVYAPKADGTAVASRSALDATCKLTVATIKKVAAFLKKNNAPKIDGSYVAIIHPYVACDLMSDPEWFDAHKYAKPENIFEGEIGRIAGVRFVESSEAMVFDGEVYSTLFMGANAYGVTEIEGGGLETIIKQKGSSGVADALDQRSSVGWKATKTAKRLIEAYLVRVESKSDFTEFKAN